MQQRPPKYVKLEVHVVFCGFICRMIACWWCVFLISLRTREALADLRLSVVAGPQWLHRAMADPAHVDMHACSRMYVLLEIGGRFEGGCADGEGTHWSVGCVVASDRPQLPEMVSSRSTRIAIPPASCPSKPRPHAPPPQSVARRSSAPAACPTICASARCTMTCGATCAATAIGPARVAAASRVAPSFVSASSLLSALRRCVVCTRRAMDRAMNSCSSVAAPLVALTMPCFLLAVCGFHALDAPGRDEAAKHRLRQLHHRHHVRRAVPGLPVLGTHGGVEPVFLLLCLLPSNRALELVLSPRRLPPASLATT